VLAHCALKAWSFACAVRASRLRKRVRGSPRFLIIPLTGFLPRLCEFRCPQRFIFLGSRYRRGLDTLFLSPHPLPLRIAIDEVLPFLPVGRGTLSSLTHFPVLTWPRHLFHVCFPSLVMFSRSGHSSWASSDTKSTFSLRHLSCLSGLIFCESGPLCCTSSLRNCRGPTLPWMVAVNSHPPLYAPGSTFGGAFPYMR